MITWFIGMSGSGKSTLAHALHARLKPSVRHLVYLDGDAFREVFQGDVDHTIAGRRRNAERISGFCKVLDDQGIHVIAAVLSIFPEWQRWNRETFSHYFEIFCDIPMATLKERDPKGLYGGTVPDVVGLDIPFPRPPAADLVIDLAEQQRGVDACLDTILAAMPKLD